MRRSNLPALGIAPLAAMMIVAGTAGCVSTQSPAPSVDAAQPVSQEARAVHETVKEFIEALNTCDLGKTMALFSQDATAFLPFPEYSKRIEGKPLISDAFSEFYDSVRLKNTGPRFMNITPQDLSVTIAGTTAMVTFQIAGGPVVSRRSFILEKLEGRWLIIHLHASNIRLPESPSG